MPDPARGQVERAFEPREHARTPPSFADTVRGEIVAAGDAGYEQARSIFNSMIERRPGADRRNARPLCADLRPYSTGSVYLNFDSESEDRVEAGFGRENYARLAAVKAEYDPDNVFHLHHNVKPLQPT